jgi:hypothetical protein
MRYLLAVLLLVHGVAHLPGFLVAFGLASFPELPYRTTVFGSLDVGTIGARAVGIGWLALSLSFIALAVILARRPDATPMVLPAVLGTSALLCVAEWPEARMGFVVNSVIAALMVVAERYGAM